MAEVKIYNSMARDFTLKLREESPNGQPVIKDYNIASLQSATVDKEAFEKAAKGNKMLQHLVDTKRLTIASKSGKIEATDEVFKRSSDLEKPADLKDTADAEQGKVKHEVKSIETVEVDVVDAPQGGKKTAS